MYIRNLKTDHWHTLIYFFLKRKSRVNFKYVSSTKSSILKSYCIFLIHGKRTSDEFCSHLGTQQTCRPLQAGQLQAPREVSLGLFLLPHINVPCFFSASIIILSPVSENHIKYCSSLSFFLPASDLCFMMMSARNRKKWQSLQEESGHRAVGEGAG